MERLTVFTDRLKKELFRLTAISVGIVLLIISESIFFGGGARNGAGVILLIALSAPIAAIGILTVVLNFKALLWNDSMYAARASVKDETHNGKSKVILMFAKWFIRCIFVIAFVCSVVLVFSYFFDIW